MQPWGSQEGTLALAAVLASGPSVQKDPKGFGFTSQLQPCQLVISLMLLPTRLPSAILTH